MRSSSVGAPSDPRALFASSQREVHPLWPVALVGLCYAGYIKGLPIFVGLSVDLTVFLFGLAVAGVMLRAFKRSLNSRALAGVAVVWLTFSVGMVNGMWTKDGPYKILLLLTVTAFCAASPAIFLTTLRSRRWFLGAVLASAVLVAVGLLIAPDQAAQTTYGRRTLEGSNAIGTARVVGAGAIVALMLGLGARRYRLPWLVAAAGLAAVTVLVGSRGPFFALVVATLLVLLTAQAFRGVRRIPTLVAGVLALAGLLVYVTNSDNRAAARIANLLTGDSVDQTRLLLAEHTLSLISRHPLGIGWGGFSEAPTPSAYLDRFTYPHNMFLEVFVEGGWLAGLVVLALVIWSLRGYLLSSQGAEGPALYGLGVYWLLVATTSGDVIANRMTWVTLFMGLAMYMQSSSSSSSHAEPRPARKRVASRAHSPLRPMAGQTAPIGQRDHAFNSEH